MSDSDSFAAAYSTLKYWIESLHDKQQAAENIPEKWLESIQDAAWSTVGEPPQQGWPAVVKEPLQSIFNRISGNASKTYVRCQPLQLDEAVLFPTLSPPESQPINQTVLNAFQQILVQSKPESGSFHQRTEQLFYALQRYGWCLPSPLEGVSLFDFARTHAAIMAVQAIEPGEVFLLGGDISGIQQFIYSLNSDGATKQLRGRSFYVQLLGEAISQMIATQAGLPRTNILYSGGGHFYLVLPGSYAQNDKLNSLRRTLGTVLLNHHAGELYVALGGAMYTDHQDSWQNVQDSINADKQRRFASLNGDALHTMLFTPQNPLWNSDTEGAATDALSTSLEKLGQDLHNKPYLWIRSFHSNRTISILQSHQLSEWHRVLRDLSIIVWPLDLSDHRLADTRGQVFEMRDLNVNEDLNQTIVSSPVRGMRYTVNVAPILDRDVEMIVDGKPEPYRAGNVMPFNLMAEYSEGIKRLGVLRMDVDDLGRLFGGGLRREKGFAGLAYTAALSAALSRFFEGWVGVLCQRINADSGNKGKVYAIYSGGDDLFIVGSWHLLPQLAATIRNDFVRYTTGLERIPAGFAPPITISAGITLHTTKFPLYQAADIAAKALDAAKAHPRLSGRTKDALNFLNQTVGWEHYEELKETYTLLRKFINEQKVSRGILITIQDMYNRYREGQKRRITRNGRPQFEFGPWVWQGKYRLVRLADRSLDPTVGQTVRVFADKLTSDIDQGFIERAGLAARWVQLSLRERKEQE